MWTFIWIVIAVVTILLIMIFSIKFVGRGHLGADQSESHYLDEVETRSRFPWA